MKRLAPLALALLLSGCSFSFPSSGPSNEMRYYVLTAPAPTGLEASSPRFGVLPVSLPGYLSRSQVVVRDEDGVNIRIYDFERWGEELGRGVARVLCDTMAVEGISAVPLRTGVQVDAKIMLDIRRLDGTLGKDIVLDAVWTVQKGKTVYRTGHIVKKLPCEKDLESMVLTQSALVQAMAKDIAKELHPR